MGIQELKDADLKSGSATGDGSTTTFAIGWTPPSEQSLFVTINGVLQSASALNLSGANCVFTAAPASGDAIEFKGIQSSGTVVTTTGDGTIDAAKLADNAVTSAKIIDDAVTINKMAGLARGSIIVGDSSGDPSALALGTSTYLLTSDGSDAAWAAAPSSGMALTELRGYRVRPFFQWGSTTTIILNSGFRYMHEGTSTQMVYGGDVTYTKTGTTASTWYYLYLDDSAIVTAGNAVITASELTESTTAPTFDSTKQTWYNGNDRCIFAWRNDDSGNIWPFINENTSGITNGGWLMGSNFGSSYIELFVNNSGTTQSTAWTSSPLLATTVPAPVGPDGFCTGAVVAFAGSHSTIEFAGPGATQDRANYAAGSNWHSIVPLDSSRNVRWRTDYSHSSYTHLCSCFGWQSSESM